MMMRKRPYCDEATDGMTRIRLFSGVLGLVVKLLDALCNVEPTNRARPARRNESAKVSRRPAPRKSRVGILRMGARALGRCASALWAFSSCAVRVSFYAAQRRAAIHRAMRSGSRSERAFGRESLLHCANILLRRKHGRLSPGTRAARRLVRSASRAAERAAERGDVRQTEAATWLAAFADLVDVDLTTLKQRRGRRKAAAAVAPPPAVVEQTVRRAPDGGEVESRFRPAHSVATPVRAAAAAESPFEDEQMVVVRPVTDADGDGLPTSFPLREDGDLEEEVMAYLATERERIAAGDPSAFAFDGD